MRDDDPPRGDDANAGRRGLGQGVEGLSQGNTTLDVTVDYLPRPNDLNRSLTTFVVWLVADDGARIRNLGELNVDSNRHGSVTVVTPLSKFRLVVTAEESGTAEKPSPYVILNGTIGQS